MSYLEFFANPCRNQTPKDAIPKRLSAPKARTIPTAICNARFMAKTVCILSPRMPTGLMRGISRSRAAMGTDVYTPFSDVSTDVLTIQRQSNQKQRQNLHKTGVYTHASVLK